MVIILATILGAILYRMGGASGYNTKFRDFGIPTCAVGVLILNIPNVVSSLWGVVSLLATWGCVFGAQTTYFKKKGTDARWYHWAAVGAANGIALLPYSLYSHSIDAMVLRTLFLTVFVSLWSSRVSNVVWEECGRGALIIASLMVYL